MLAVIAPTTNSLNYPHDIKIAITVIAVLGIAKLFFDLARRSSTRRGLGRFREPGTLRLSYLVVIMVIFGLVLLLHHDDSLCAMHPGIQSFKDTSWHLGTVRCF